MTFARSHKIPGIDEVYVMDGADQALTNTLHSLGMDKASRVRIILPPCERAVNGSAYAFVCYDWNYVFSSKEVDASLSRTLPNGFLDAVKEVDPDGPHGTWVIQYRHDPALLRGELADSVGPPRRPPFVPSVA